MIEPPPCNPDWGNGESADDRAVMERLARIEAKLDQLLNPRDDHPQEST